MIVNNYFWRTYDKQEIDWLEEREGKLFGYELKWNLKKTPTAPKVWTEAYPDSEFYFINRENYLDWVRKK